MELDGAGENDAAKPSELLLAALCGCTGMDVISICRKKRQMVTAYSVRARGEQRAGHPRTFETIDVEHHFEGEALDAVAIARAVELSATRYCLVNASLSGGDTRITHRYTIEDAAGTRSGAVVVTGPHGAGLKLG
jgi:putative redox protein